MPRMAETNRMGPMTAQTRIVFNPICAATHPLNTQIYCICRYQPGHHGEHQCGICAHKWEDDE